MKQLLHKLFIRWLPNKLLLLLALLVPLLTFINFFIPDIFPLIDEALLTIWSIALVKETARRGKERIDQVMVNTPGYSGPERRRFPRTNEPPPRDRSERRRSHRVAAAIEVRLTGPVALPPSQDEIP